MTWHHDVWWPSEKHRTFVFSPYTDDDDAKTTLGVGLVLTTSSITFTIPATFECTYAPGFFAA